MNREKILLINPKYKSRDIIYFPLGLGYIAGACNEEEIEVECLDLCVLDVNSYHILDKIQKNDYRIIGIGGFTTQLKSAMELTNLIKNTYKDITVILGGVQVFGCEKFIMTYSKADIICTGESETILPKVVHAIYREKNLSDIPSIIYRQRGELVRNDGFFLIENLDDIPFPQYDTFQIEKYIKENYHSVPGRRTIDFIISRGCPYKCCYCINSKRPVKVRYRSPENILTEIRLLKKKYHINDFSFCDEVFTINKKKAIEICENIKGEDITWLTSCRADNIDGELLSVMKEAGCRMLLIGFESGSEKLLSSMDKKVNVETYTEAIRLLREYDMQFYPSFMIGMPQETEETIRETEKFCKDNYLLFASSYVTPFPGTQLYNDVKHKIVDEKEYLYSLADKNYSKEPTINLTKMSMKRLIFLRNRAVVNTMVHIIHRRFEFIPVFFIEAACWCYIFLFLHKRPVISKKIRLINKLIYRVFSI